MSVIRIEKNKNYTVMSNFHLKEKEMSLKAKGLLSMILALPDNWNYSIAGLVSICKENETAIKSALKELKTFGYLKVVKKMADETETGRIEYEYIIYEEPQKQNQENLGVENLYIENPRQLNTNKLNTNNIDNNISNINITNMENSKNSEITIEETKIDNIEKPKKKKELTKKQINAIQRTKILEEFIKDEPEELKKALRDYVDVRQNERNLQAKQLQIILEDFEKAYKNKPLSEILTQIRKATARGWSALVYEDKFNQNSYKSNYSSKPTFDNTANHNVGKAVADMTPEEYEYYCQHQLARDENGNYIKF